MGSCCAWLPLCGGHTKVVSARLNPSHGTRYVRGVCNFLSSVLRQERFEMADQCYSSVTAQFYSASKGKHILEAGGPADPTDAKRREAPAQFRLLFLCFSPPPEPALCKLACQEGCLFYLRSSLWSSDLPLF